MAINVTATPLLISTRLNQVVYSHFPPVSPNTAYDSYIYLSYASATDTLIEITLHGTWLSVGVSDSVLDVTLTLSGSFVEAVSFSVSDALELELELRGDMVVQLSRSSWVKWSNIGSLDFTIGRDNVAGERPMKWSGWAYLVRKLGDRVVVYGQNGISVMTPKSVAWGAAELSSIGIQGRTAFCGNDKVHFFIDAKYRLCQLGEKLDILGYEEFLSAMGPSIVLSYDEAQQRVFICDGSVGYVYSAANKGLGRGPFNITGWGKDDLICAPADITSLPFEICTDIYDMGTRKNKTIRAIELGLDTTLVTYAAIDWRIDKAVAFATTPWTRVNPSGIANLPCFGREFRFRVKQLTYEEIKLDYIKVVGILHNYSFLDSFLRGRQV